jgi:hypothetical protein
MYRPSGDKQIKVFWFFFSKKNFLLGVSLSFREGDRITLRTPFPASKRDAGYAS